MLSCCDTGWTRRHVRLLGLNREALGMQDEPPRRRRRVATEVAKRAARRRQQGDVDGGRCWVCDFPTKVLSWVETQDSSL